MIKSPMAPVYPPFFYALENLNSVANPLLSESSLALYCLKLALPNLTSNEKCSFRYC